MYEPTEDELRRLRERAYGPDADIDLDPAAMARLLELEALQPAPAPSDVGVSVTESPGADEFAGSHSATGSGDSSRADSSSPEPGNETTDAVPSVLRPFGEDADDAAHDPPTSHRKRRTILLATGALVLAALVGAGVTYSALSSHPGSVAVLAPTPDAVWPENFGDRRPGGEVFEEYLGLEVYLVPQPWSDTGTVPCLFVLSDASPSSIVTAGCGAGAFAPTAAVQVSNDMSLELLERYPAGSALQFVLDDGRVVVYAD
jgi:hypothetical protein